MTCHVSRTAASWCSRRPLKAGYGCAISCTRLAAPAGYGGCLDSFWSPDSRYVAFIVDDTLRRIDTTGGPPDTVASLPTAAPRSGTWNRHGDIVLGSWGADRVARCGEYPRQGRGDAGDAGRPIQGRVRSTWPTFLPDGSSFYTSLRAAGRRGHVRGSLDVDAGNQSRQRVLATSVQRSSRMATCFFPRAGTLMAQPFDARRLELQGAPVPVAQD